MKKISVILAAAMGLAILAAPASAQTMGEREYMTNCGICHGTAPGGPAPYDELLKKKAPDLSILAKNNNGVFPFERVYAMVDGREAVKAHGPREMPIWGDVYNAKAAEYYFEFRKGYDAEAYIRARVLALIDYLNSVQQK